MRPSRCPPLPPVWLWHPRRPGMEEGAWSALRQAALVFNVAGCVCGIILSALGAELTAHHVTTSTPTPTAPPLWVLGILPSLLAMYGAVTIIIGHRTGLLSWLCVLTLSTPLCFLYVSLHGYLEPAQFGVNIHILGSQCGGGGSRLCACVWSPPSPAPLPSCESVRASTLLFLALALLLVLCLVLSAGAAAFVTAELFCLGRCLQTTDCPVYTTMHGDRMRDCADGFVQQTRLATYDKVKCEISRQLPAVVTEYEVTSPKTGPISVVCKDKGDVTVSLSVLNEGTQL